MAKRDKSTGLKPPGIKTVISGNGGGVVVASFYFIQLVNLLCVSDNGQRSLPTWHTLDRGILLVVARGKGSSRGTATVQQTVFVSITPYIPSVDGPGLKDPKPGWRLVRRVVRPSVPEII